MVFLEKRKKNKQVWVIILVRSNEELALELTRIEIDTEKKILDKLIFLVAVLLYFSLLNTDNKIRDKYKSHLNFLKKQNK